MLTIIQQGCTDGGMWVLHSSNVCETPRKVIMIQKTLHPLESATKLVMRDRSFGSKTAGLDKSPSAFSRGVAKGNIGGGINENFWPRPLLFRRFATTSSHTYFLIDFQEISCLVLAK